MTRPSAELPNPGPLMIDLAGLSLAAGEAERLRHPAVGGIILFGRNYAEPEQLRQLVREIRQQRPNLLIAIDHEGGRVQRCREGFTRLPPAASYGEVWQADAELGVAYARAGGQVMAAELLQYGIDFSFAPVVDIDLGVSQVIGDRCFHPSVAGVVALAGAFITGMAEAGMAAVLKHFPGHGGVVADSHLTLPEDLRGLQALEAFDLQPFQQLLALPSVSGVMPAHVRYPQVDPAPAGFSEFWLQQVLRQRLRFGGMIFSDDLSMQGAVDAYASVAQRCQVAQAAGCDMLLVCNDPAAAEQALAQPLAPLSQPRYQAMRGQLALSEAQVKQARQRLAQMITDLA